MPVIRGYNSIIGTLVSTNSLLVYRSSFSSFFLCSYSSCADCVDLSLSILSFINLEKFPTVFIYISGFIPALFCRSSSIFPKVLGKN